MTVYKVERSPIALTLALIVSLGAIAYHNSFVIPFQFDDFPGIVEDPTFQSQNVAQMFYRLPNRFLTTLSFALNFQVSQWDVFGFHILNLIIHLATAMNVFVLVFQLLRLTETRSNHESRTFMCLAAACSAFIFTSHPLNTQAVSYIWQRSTLLATMFYLVSLNAFLRSELLILNGNRRRSITWQWSAVAAAVAGCFSKQISATLPLMIWLSWFLFFKNTFKGQSLPWSRLMPWVFPLLLGPGLLLVHSLELEHIKAANLHGSGSSAWNYLLTQSPVVLAYLKLWFFPIGQNIDHDVPIVASALEMRFLLATLAHGLILTLAWLARRKIVVFSYGILFFYLALTVESSIIPLEDVMFEHRMYLPSIGILVSIMALMRYGYDLHASHFQSLVVQNKTMLTLLLALSVSPLIYLTVERNRVWASSMSLWHDAYVKSPNKGRPRYNLANELMKQNHLGIAKAVLEPILATNVSDRYKAYMLFGVIYGREGDLIKSEELLLQAVTLRPNDLDAYNNLGITYALSGQFTKAEVSFKQALQIGPWKSSIALSLARVLVENGKKEASRLVYQQIIGSTISNSNDVMAAKTELSGVEQ